MQSGPIHQRTIKIETFETGENKILIQGTLIDERLCPAFVYLLSRVASPQTVHNITLRVGLSLPDLVIESVDTDMSRVPTEMCRNAADACIRLIGVSMSRGFKRRVRELTGGVNGCVHLNNLLLSIHACAYQGAHTYYHRVREGKEPVKAHLDDSLVVNSCHVWSESGPFAPRLKELKKAAEDACAAKDRRS